MNTLRKLRLRLIIVMMATITIMLIIIFGLVTHMTHVRIRDDNIHMMESVANAPMGSHAERHPQRRGDGQNATPQFPFFRVQIDESGNILATDGNVYDFTQEDSEELLKEMVAEVLASPERISELGDFGLRYYCTRDAEKPEDPMEPFQDYAPPSSESDETAAEGTAEAAELSAAPADETVLSQPRSEEGPVASNGKVIVFADISLEIATMHNLYRTCVIIGLGSLGIFLIASLFFSRWVIRPVEMAWIQQRQFVSDASHELKTPLTVILTDAEMLKSPGFSAERKAQFVDNILTMSNQMRGLVESLLQLARVDNGALQKKTMQTIRLSEFVSDELLTFEALFYEKGLTLTDRIAEDITVQGSEPHLKQVIEILLDNAQKYADANGIVQVSLQRSNTHHCLLTVSDPGDPISAQDLKKIFQRFYRIDEARAMNHSYGLGLSIAENIVKAHKGRIWAESADGINSFHVELPLA